MQACFDKTSISELQKYIVSYKRLDLEQAAALAISQLPEQQALQVLKSIPTILSSSCMWREVNDQEAPLDPSAAAAENRLKQLDALLQSQGMQHCDRLQDLTAALMTMRRKRPKHDNKHRLSMPDCLLDSLAPFSTQEAGSSSLRKQWQEHFKHPQSDLQPRACRGVARVVSKKIFSRLQTHLSKLAGDQSQAGKLHRSVDDLENLVEKGAGRYDSLQATPDKIALAFSFMAIQRQRQLKVVSDYGWTTFLKKGEGAQVQQNTPSQLTSFEMAIWQVAVSRPASEIDWDALTAITSPDGPTVKSEDLLDLIDQTCLLMEQYVRVHGRGSYANLRFHPGSRGGSGRGPVDLYNQLVDILKVLKSRAEQAGQPLSIEPCYKFLAKDIYGLE